MLPPHTVINVVVSHVHSEWACVVPFDAALDEFMIVRCAFLKFSCMVCAWFIELFSNISVYYESVLLHTTLPQFPPQVPLEADVMVIDLVCSHHKESLTTTLHQ